MRLIIDSGSTKMEWILLDGETVKNRFTTNGFNPNYADIQSLENILSSVETPCFASLQKVHYYGTGCGSERNCQLIKEVFQSHFPEAEIYVTHDLMAVCHAVLGHEKGIACILGTGSNSCVYDGKDIVDRAVSLGYLVGDEGSGSHIGSAVVRAYFYGFMHEDLRQSFDATFHLELKDFVQQLYHNEQPSLYLASFAKFAGEHQNHPYVRALVKDCFWAFVKAFVCRYSECKTMQVNFVGSIAYYYKDILEKAVNAAGMRMGIILKGPIDGLVEYHKNAK